MFLYYEMHTLSNMQRVYFLKYNLYNMKIYVYNLKHAICN